LQVEAFIIAGSYTYDSSNRTAPAAKALACLSNFRETPQRNRAQLGLTRG